MIIAFVSCVSKKQKGNHKASEIYTSNLFKKSFAYAKKISHKIIILSAKYGAINPDEIITDYDLTLNTFSEKEKKIWAFKVYQNISKFIKSEDEIIWLCGENYCKYLRVILKNKQTKPIKGLGIGKQLKFYKEGLK